MRKSTITLTLFAIAALCVLMSTFESPVIGQGRTGDPAPNDDCVDATEVGNVGRFRYNTTGATTAADDPCISCCFFGVGQNGSSIWFRLNVTRDSSIVRANTIGSNYDTVLAIWSTVGDVCPTGVFTPSVSCDNDAGVTEVACNDDSVGLQSEVQVVANDGDVLFIEVAECTGTAPGIGGTAQVQITQGLR